MGKKRKWKKQQNQAKNQEPKKEIPKETAISEAMKKAKQSQKFIEGFGSKGKSKIIHAITNVENSSLCDIRIKDIEIQKELTASNVTCKKCMGYKLFKQLLKNNEKPADEKNEEKPDVDVGKQETKQEEKKQPIPTVKEAEEEVDWDDFEKLKVLMNSRFKRMEERITKKLEEYCRELLEKRPSFFIVRKANNMFQIVHDNSRYVICDNITEEKAEKLLKIYLSMKYSWDGQTKPPREWIHEIKEIHEKFFNKTNNNDNNTDKNKKSRRVLKRRTPKLSMKEPKKEIKRIIKRRQK